MLKQKSKKSRLSIVGSLAGIVVVAAVLAGGTYSLVRADQFDEQIRQLQNQNNANQAASNQLGSQASSYQDKIDKLQVQISALQSAIVANEQASAKLQKDIDAKKAELAHQKKVLGEDIKAMYLEGQISTLEILAASKDLSDFVNKETARNAVQNKVQDTVAQITQLKLQLEEQQRELQSRIHDQKNQQGELASAQSQQAQLLSYTEAQKANYDSQIQNNNDKISSLRAQQAAANRALGGQVTAGDPGHGGYPARWDNAPQDSQIDSWGMYNRECVSYTAWKVYSSGKYMPYWGGRGNANQWPGDAQAAGIPTGSVPKVHSVAISMGGYYGHAMWVEAVSGSMIYVSQYNYDLAGHYSEMWVNGSNFIYIYF